MVPMKRNKIGKKAEETKRMGLKAGKAPPAYIGWQKNGRPCGRRRWSRIKGTAPVPEISKESKIKLDIYQEMLIDARSARHRSPTHTITHPSQVARQCRSIIVLSEKLLLPGNWRKSRGGSTVKSCNLNVAPSRPTNKQTTGRHAGIN